jgi:hypothetical protein
MGLDGNPSKSTILMVGVNAMPTRAIGAAIEGGVRGHRPDLQNAMLGWGVHGITVEVAVQLGELKPDGGDGWLHLGLPLGEGLVEGRHHLLQHGDAGVTQLIRCSNFLQALGEGGLVDDEPFLDLDTKLLESFLEEELDVGVHGTKDGLLPMGVVDGVQIIAGT